MSDIAALAGDALGLMTPVLFAALGGLLSELAGMLNIALEGLIGVGAFAAAVVAIQSGSLAAGIAVGAATGAVVAWGFGAATLRLRANAFVTGLAVNLLASGLTVSVSARLFHTKGVVKIAAGALPVLSPEAMGQASLPGRIFLGHDILTYASWMAVPLVWLLVARTPFGMRLRAAGSNPRALVTLGKKPDRYKIIAVILSGLACGLAGASLSLGLGAYVPNATAGRGWIALVAVYLGGRGPAGVLAACFVFALASSLANYAQGFLTVPSDFILALPYVITLLALVGAAVWKRLRQTQ